MKNRHTDLVNKINFSKSPDGLVPVILQDASTRIVLMLGYMNKEALEKTVKTNLVTFFSRSKNRLWVKGETSRNCLHVVDIKADCDFDTLLILATPDGKVCHTGSDTCFDEKNTFANFLHTLEKIVENRKNEPGAGSYTSSLFAKGINKIAQKVGEEAVELVIEAKDDNRDLFINEAADLLFHYLILLQAKNESLKNVLGVLEERHRKMQ